MPSGVHLSWPALASIIAGIAPLYIAWYGWPFRNQPGAKLWVGILAMTSLWSISYGVALTVFDPAIRPLFEIPIWLARNAIPPLSLAFALEYTGRGHLVRSNWMAGVFGVFGVTFLLYATNPLHGLMWNGYRIAPVFGAAAVRYTPRLLLIGAGLAYLLIALTMFLLLETVLSYGRLFRRQAVALLAGFAAPTVTNVAWLYRLGPAKHLDLTPITFIFTALLSSYVLFRGGMFEMLPAARRIADRLEIDELGVAVITVTPDAQLINLNDEAAGLFDIDQPAALGQPLMEFIDIEVPITETRFTVPNPIGRGREYRVSVSPVDGPGGHRVGYTITFQDITEERLRQQRLTVLNRILRHNLRNDVNVIQVNAEEAKQRIAATTGGSPGEAATERDREPRPESMIETIIDRATELNRIGEKARDIEKALSEDITRSTTVDLKRVSSEIIADFERRFPDAELTLSVMDSVRIQASERVVQLVLENLIENGIVHTETDPPAVSVTISADATKEWDVVIKVVDNGPGIPENELSVLRRAEEAPLEHGSGIGLWVVSWGVKALGGSVDFKVDKDGTVVEIRLPKDADQSVGRTDTGALM